MSNRHSGTAVKKPTTTDKASAAPTHKATPPPRPAARQSRDTGGRRAQRAARGKKRLPLRLYAPKLTIVVAEVVASALVGIEAWRRLDWPWLVATAAVVLLVSFLAFKDASLTHWAVIWWRWWRNRGNNSATQLWSAGPEVVDVKLPGDEGKVGIRWDGDMVITAVELCPRPHTPTVLADGVAVTADTIPMDVVAGCLWQFDINLAGIDVASSGRRVVPGTAYARSYDQGIGVRPGVVSRRTWLILRMRFDADDPGIRNRGGGIEGAVLTAVAATRRAVRRLREADCGAVAADSDALHAAHAALAAGLNVDETQNERGTLATANRFVTTYRLHPDDLTNVNLGAWWSHRSLSTSVIIRLTPRKRRGEVGMRAWVRYASVSRPERSDRLPGLIRQYTDQAEALTATLPLGEHSWKAQRSIVTSPQAVVNEKTLAGLQIPVGPGGQLIGTTPTNHPMLLPLAEPGMLTRIYVDAELWVAQQLVLRALPSGATTRITSCRPEAWWPMLRRLAEPRRLWLAQTDGNRPASMQVCDHVPLSYPADAETLLMVGTNDAQMAAEADVIIRHDRRSDKVIVSVGGRPWPLMLSVTKEETRYLGRLD
jgi:type VII secretion protein EccE